MQITSHTDDRDRSKDFRRGDIVYPINPREGTLLQVSGLITAVHRGIGMVDVEFPWGNKRYLIDDVVRVPPTLTLSLPPNKDTSYGAWDIDKSRLDDRTLARVARVADRWVASSFELRSRAAQLMVEGRGRYAAVTTILSEETEAGRSGMTHAVTAAVEHVYDVIPKIALYWHSPNRTYRPSRAEIKDGSFSCPRCREAMSQSIFRKGSRLYSCVNCLFMISPDDIYNPSEIKAATHAHKKLTAALGGKDGWIIAHAPGRAAAFHGLWGMTYKAGGWSVLDQQGRTAKIVASPREAYAEVMMLKQADRRPNNDAEDLIRDIVEDPEADTPGDMERVLRETAQDRADAMKDHLGNPDTPNIDFYRAAGTLSRQLRRAADATDAETLSGEDVAGLKTKYARHMAAV